MSLGQSQSHLDKPGHGYKEDADAESDPGNILTNVDRDFERATIRKVDRRVLIILGAIYAVSLIDRTNISVARVAGMARDLRLTVGERYSIISLVFFVPYIIFELPSNIVLRKIGARNHLTGITVLWGAVMLGMGFVKNWHQLTACRVLLGLLESGFFPGCVFLISCWYTRFQTQKRMAFFYLTSMVISGFSNIIGYAMSLLNGKAGLAGWRWIFILFGIITMVLGIIAAFTIQDFPDKNTFLTKEQTALITARIQADRGDAVPDKLTMGAALKHLGDFKLWIMALMFMCSTMPAYAFAYFLPVILAGGGFDTKTSLLLSAPPYACAAIYTFAVALMSDKQKLRGPWICLSATVCMVGLFIMAYGKLIGVRYFGSFLAISGCQANVPAILTYAANNVLSHSKRAVSSALVIGFGGIGGIFASLVYRQKDYPRYLPGLWATVGCQIFILAAVLGLSFFFRKVNREVDAGTRVLEEKPGFKYTISMVGRLDVESLAVHTKFNPPNARNTVQSFLDNQRQFLSHSRYDSLHSSPHKSFHQSFSSPAASPRQRLNQAASASAADDLESFFGRPAKRETALVMHAPEQRPSTSSERKAKSKDVDGKLRPTLVGAMKPRLAGQPKRSPPNVPLALAVPGAASELPRSDRQQQVQRDGDDGGNGRHDSSPVLVARKVAAASSQGKGGDPVASTSAAVTREAVTAEGIAARADATGGGAGSHQKLTARAREKQREANWDSGEEAEHLDRLEARRTRRREKALIVKALIVKDRTQSARATGAAAGQAVKAKTRGLEAGNGKRKRQDSEGDSIEMKAAGDERHRKDKKSVNDKARAALQSKGKAANVGATRLTILPNKYGLFSKGVTSGRTKVTVGKHLPDLAFSELAFLDQPQRHTSNPPPGSRSTSPRSRSSDVAMAPPPQPSTRMRTVTTYGARHKVITLPPPSSRYFPASSPHPPPLAPSPRPESESSAPRHLLSPQVRTSAHKPGLELDCRNTSQSKRRLRSSTDAHNAPMAPLPRTSERRRTSETFAVIIPPRPATSSSGRSAYSRAKARQDAAKSPSAPATTDSSTRLRVLDTTGMWGVKRTTRSATRSSLTASAPNSAHTLRSGAERSASVERGSRKKKSASVSTIDRLIRACHEERLPSLTPRSFYGASSTNSRGVVPIPAEEIESRTTLEKTGSTNDASMTFDQDLEMVEEFVEPQVATDETATFEDILLSLEELGSAHDNDDMAQRSIEEEHAAAVAGSLATVVDQHGFVHLPRGTDGASSPFSASAEPCTGLPLQHSNRKLDEDAWERDPSSLGLDELDNEFDAWQSGAEEEAVNVGMERGSEGPSRLDPTFAQEMQKHWYRVQV